MTDTQQLATRLLLLDGGVLAARLIPKWSRKTSRVQVIKIEVQIPLAQRQNPPIDLTEMQDVDADAVQMLGLAMNQQIEEEDASVSHRIDLVASAESAACGVARMYTAFSAPHKSLDIQVWLEARTRC